MRKYFRAHFCLDFTDRDAKSGRIARAFLRLYLFLCAFLCVVFDEEIHASNLLQNATKAHGKNNREELDKKTERNWATLRKLNTCFWGAGRTLPDYNCEIVGTILIGIAQPFFQCAPPLL